MFGLGLSISHRQPTAGKQTARHADSKSCFVPVEHWEVNMTNIIDIREMKARIGVWSPQRRR
jgi:hypothetical protein